MSDPIEVAVDRLVELLCDAIVASLRAKSFYPSERFQEELADLIRSHVGLS